MKLLLAGRGLLLLAALGSCSAEDALSAQGGDDVLTVNGKLEVAAPVSSEVVLGWVVSDGDPDYEYLWGRADVRGTAFSLQLKTRPPKEALSQYGLGVARLLSVPKSAHTPEGKLQGDVASSLAQSISGLSRLAVLYVDHDLANAAISSANDLTDEEREAAREHWLFDFPPGYSCAKGRAALPGETFDSFVPVDCAELAIEAGTDAPFPNWT